MNTDDDALDDHELEAAIAHGFDQRDRANMQPTIAYFEDLLARHPGHAAVLYELAGSYDTAGDGSGRRRCIGKLGGRAIR